MKMMKFVDIGASDRDVSEHYSISVPLKDFRGDSVIFQEFEDLNEVDILEATTLGYKHPHVECGLTQLPGAKDQDRYDVYASQDESKDPHFFAIYDGHGLTATAADICAAELRSTIFQIDKEMKLENGDTEDNDFVVPSDEAIVEAFHQIDEKIKKRTDDPRTGTCAIVLMIGKRVIERAESATVSMDSSDSGSTVEGIAKVAWVGDSRCIMIDEDDNVTALSDDHRVDTHEGERQRIEQTQHPVRPGLEESEFWKTQAALAKKTGEELRRRSFIGVRRDGGPQVLFSYSGGISLQISRSLGDSLAARSAIATPEIKTIKHSGEIKNVRFVLASDGVWDVMNTESVAKFVKKYKDPKVASSKLCQFAKNKRLYRGLYADDISVIVVDVNSDKKSGGRRRKSSRCKVM